MVELVLGAGLAARVLRSGGGLKRLCQHLVKHLVHLLCHGLLGLLARLHSPPRQRAGEIGARRLDQVDNRLGLGSILAPKPPAYVAARLLAARVVPLPVCAGPEHQLAPARPNQDAFRLLAVVCNLEARLQKQAHRQGDGDGDEAHDERVQRVAVVREGRAGVIHHAVGVVRQHRNIGELVLQRAALACEAAAGRIEIRCRAVAAVEPAIQHAADIGAARSGTSAQTLAACGAATYQQLTLFA